MKNIFIILLLLFISSQIYNHNMILVAVKEQIQMFNTGKAKHETNFNTFAKSNDTITIETILSWEKKYKTKTNQINRKNVNLTRVRETPEDSLYILKGYMYFVKHEKSSGGDCDFHIEIGPVKKSKRRIVVEITKDNCSEQKKVMDHIKGLWDINSEKNLQKEFLV